ncbi:hypothetical protein HY523_00580 [Candidatus Berkelbacteria bacterium]|nr:hypothetical protein [Candidatus Berkelbacteria bacterium]
MTARLVCFGLGILCILIANFPASAPAQDRKPTIAEARQVVQGWIARNSNGCIRLVSLRKTNGQRLTYFGVPAYAMECTLVFDTLRHCRLMRNTKLDVRPIDDPQRFDRMDSQGFEGGRRYTLKKFSVGFFLTDNGWVGER